MNEIQQTPEVFQEKLNQLETAIKALKNAVNLFPVNMSNEILFDKWSLKDILAHLSGWNLITIRDLTKLMKGEEIAQWFPETAIDDFNEQEVVKRQGENWVVVYGEFYQTLDELLATYRSLNDDQWEQQLGPNESTPLDCIIEDLKHFGGEHLEDIRSATLNINSKYNQ
ncbi:MAG: hypothetical protein ABIM99_01215 [Candidatus Dojkabacteria bacterium]